MWGSTFHATGVGLGAILFGSFVSAVLSVIVLVFQAFLLAHDGISTLGANTFLMGIARAFAGWFIYKLGLKIGIREDVVVFLAAFVADLTTYAVTAGQLALAFPDVQAGFWGNYLKYASVFALTQLPITIVEGIVRVVMYNSLAHFARQGLISIRHKEG